MVGDPCAPPTDRVGGLPPAHGVQMEGPEVDGRYRKVGGEVRAGRIPGY